MTATYSGDPADGDPINEIRFLIGDTDVASANVSDEAITYAYDGTGKSIMLACAMLCRSIAASKASSVRISVEGVSIDDTASVKNWLDMADRFEEQAAGSGSIVPALVLPGSTTTPAPFSVTDNFPDLNNPANQAKVPW